MSFTQLNLNANILKAISICGFSNPTPIQSQSIPSILEGKDLVASAQTGTGKTAAFVLPALHRLSSSQPSKKTRILILTPTRELATQITKAAHDLGKFLRFNIVNLVGGMPYHHQIRDLARGADIIVATPGRLMDHMEQKRVDLSNIEMLVLDEADRMSDMGFIDDVQYIAKLTPSHRQTLLFSATIDKQLTTVVRHLLKNPVRIDLSQKAVASPQVKQELYKANNPQHKARLLKHFLNDANIYKAIIFSSTKINADKIANQLCFEGFAAAALHGDLKQKVRNRTIDQLRRGKIQFLVATDVAARGIDISDISHVINYDMPKFCEDYVHRIGRTGRAGKSGTAISFVLPTDTRHLQRIERFIGQRLTLIHHVELNDSSMPKEPEAMEILTLKKDQRPHRDYDRRTEHTHEKKKYFSKHKDHGSRNERRFDKPGKSHEKNFAKSDRYDDRRSEKSGKKRWEKSDRFDNKHSERFGEKRFNNADKRKKSNERKFDSRSDRAEKRNFDRPSTAGKKRRFNNERRSIKSE